MSSIRTIIMKICFSDGLTLWLLQLMYHCYSMWSLRCSVNHFRASICKLVGFHHSHLGPVREIDIVLKQTDAKWMRDHSTSVNHCFSIRKNIRDVYLLEYINEKSYYLLHLIKYLPMQAVIGCSFNVVIAAINPVDALSFYV